MEAQSEDSVFSQLGNVGQAWREYVEAMPVNCVGLDPVGSGILPVPA